MSDTDTTGPEVRIIDCAGRWPFEVVNRPEHVWLRITGQNYEDLRDVLPPADWSNNDPSGPYWFAVGEPSTHTRAGVPVHAIAVHLPMTDRYYLRELPLERVHVEDAVSALLAVIG